MNVLELIGGLAFFLFGMNVMSANLEKMAGGKLEILLKKVTANPFLSLTLGAIITIAMQSSSATTVMLVGLVNSGIMKFSQTLFVIYGSNIGTTLTAWILSLSSISSDVLWIKMLKPENFSPILALIGIIMLMVCKNDKKKSIGTIFVGFAVLMYGMEMMSGAVSPLAGDESFQTILTKFNNPIIGVVIGTVFTAIIQSSAASIGILQALSLTGKISFGMAIPIVMGQNIGTCATALISCIGANINAKRVAAVHLGIKIVSTVVFLSLFEILNAALGFTFISDAVTPVTIAVIHTVFNIISTLLFVPITNFTIKLTEKLVKESKNKIAENGNDNKEDTKEALPYLDERILASPSFAISECGNFTIKMAEIARDNVIRAMKLFENYDEKEAEKIYEIEDVLDNYEDRISTFLVKLSAQSLSQKDSRSVSKMLHVIGDFERLGDHALNLLKAAKETYDKKIKFTVMAESEQRVLVSAVDEILSLTITSFIEDDVDLAFKVEPLEQVIDTLIAQMKNNHIKRLQHGDCTIEIGFVLSDILTNYERISDHCSNIAVAVIELVHDSFDTHKYLNDIKYGNNKFNDYYESYYQKYSISPSV